MLRCTACKSVLTDPEAKRCPLCRTSLRRNRPVNLSAHRVGPRFVSPIDAARARERLREQAREQRAAARALRRRAAAGATPPGPVARAGGAVYLGDAVAPEDSARR